MKIGYNLQSETDNSKIKIISTDMPSMKNSGDSFWDCVQTIYIDNEKTEIYADTTWGAYGYFKFNDNWYKLSTENWEDLYYKQEFKMLYY